MTYNKAFILAAGFGMRMRPLTLERPKPLLEVGSRSLLERTLDHFEQNGINDVVINTHYLGEQIPRALEGRADPALLFSAEDPILDTGGGIKKMIGHFGAEPFFVLSGDGMWSEKPGAKPVLHRLGQIWDDETMDILMVLQSVETMSVTKGVGDYDLTPDGRAIRSKNQTGAYMFTSMRLNHPRLFHDTPEGAFSYLELLDRAQAQGRLFGIVHEGDWHHISTPQDLEAVTAHIAKKE